MHSKDETRLNIGKMLSSSKQGVDSFNRVDVKNNEGESEAPISLKNEESGATQVEAKVSVNVRQSSSWIPYGVKAFFLEQKQPWLAHYYASRWSVLNPFHKSFLLCGVEISIGELLMFCLVVGGAAVACAVTWTPPASPAAPVAGRRLDGEDSGAENTGSNPDVLMALTFLTVCRNSLLTFLIGIPFERALTWHKLFAYLAIATGLVHTANAIVLEGWSLEDEYLSGYVCMGALIALYLSSLPFIRRWLFTLFHYLHLILVVVVVVSGFAHGAGIFAIGAGFWLLDVLYRYFFMTFTQMPREATVQALPAGVIRISFDRFPNYEPGQYVFICVPGVTHFEWHPFSLSSCPHHEQACIHVRTLGNWTRKLYKLAEKESKIRILVDGPYGEPCVDVWGPKYTRFLMISGGIGITPLMSMCNTLMHEHETQGRSIDRIRFVWSVRDLYMVETVQNKAHEGNVNRLNRLPYSFSPQDVLEELNTEPDSSPLVTEFYLTRCERKNMAEANIHPENQPYLKFNRPNLEKIFRETSEEVVRDSGRGRVCVLTCGPSKLVQDAKRLAYKYSKKGVSFDFHSEKFKF